MSLCVVFRSGSMVLNVIVVIIVVPSSGVAMSNRCKLCHGCGRICYHRKVSLVSVVFSSLCSALSSAFVIDIVFVLIIVVVGLVMLWLLLPCCVRWRNSC